MTDLGNIMNQDNHTIVNELKSIVSAFVCERDWQKYHTPKNLAESICIEASELLELFQWLSDSDIQYTISNLSLEERIENEVADVIIYCISLSNNLGIDITSAIKNKIRSNHKKYPITKTFNPFDKK